MQLTVEATYEDGALKPIRPLPLAEREKVQVTVGPPASPLLAANPLIYHFTGQPTYGVACTLAGRTTAAVLSKSHPMSRARSKRC